MVEKGATTPNPRCGLSNRDFYTAKAKKKSVALCKAGTAHHDLGQDQRGLFAR